MFFADYSISPAEIGQVVQSAGFRMGSGAFAYPAVAAVTVLGRRRSADEVS
jgi:hypothetical protein